MKTNQNISKIWYVWVGTCSCALIPRHDQPLQPPGILIFVAVWAKDGLADSWTIAGFSVCAGMHSTHFTNLLYLLEIFQSYTPFPCNCGACCFQCHCKRSWVVPEWLTAPAIVSYLHCFLFSFTFSMTIQSLHRQYNSKKITSPSRHKFFNHFKLFCISWHFHWVSVKPACARKLSLFLKLLK